MSSHEAIDSIAENTLKRKVVSTEEPERDPNDEPASKALRADDGNALSPPSIAGMAYNAVRAVRTYAVRTYNAYAVRTDIPQLRQEEAQTDVPTTESAAMTHAESKGMHADIAEQSANSTTVIRKEIESGPSTSASEEVRRQLKSNAEVNGASVHDSHLITVKQEQIEPGPSTSASAAVQLAADESIGDVKLKKVTKVELRRGYTSWYTEISPAYLKVTDESGETRELFRFAQLHGCLVDEMVFECRDATTDKLVKQLYKDKSIDIHVNRLVVRKIGGLRWDHFESGIKRLQELAEGLRSLHLIVWEGMTEKHLEKLPSFVRKKLVFEYRDDIEDLEVTKENFSEIMLRPTVKVEKYFTLPAPIHVHVDSFGGHFYEMTMLSLMENLHKVHKDGGNIVTLKRAVRPWHSNRGFWVRFATSLFKFVKVTANPASRLPEFAERCAWITDAMSDVKNTTFRLELDYRDGARKEFEMFAKSQVVEFKLSDGESPEFTANYGPYDIRCAFALEPSITVKVYGLDEVQENSLVSISIVKRE